MTLSQFLGVLTKRCVLVVAITILFFVASVFVSFLLMEDVYQATTTIIVSNQAVGASSEQLTYNDYSLNVKLVNSYSVICKTNLVLDQVIAELNLPMTVEGLGRKVSVSSAKDTEIIHISVKDSSPLMAQSIANSLTRVFREEVKNIMQMDNVQIIDEAPIPKNPVEPNRLRNIIIGTMIGIMAGLGLAFLLEYMDRTVKTDVQVEEVLDIPVLASVPKIEKNHSDRRS